MGEDTSGDFSESFLVTLILTDIAIAMFDSVTVSMGEDTSGDFSESFLVTLILTNIAIAMLDFVTVSMGGGYQRGFQ